MSVVLDETSDIDEGNVVDVVHPCVEDTITQSGGGSDMAQPVESTMTSDRSECGCGGAKPLESSVTESDSGSMILESIA